MRVYFYVATVTQAMRGKNILRANGMDALVGRNTDMYAGAGCGYTVSVSGDGARAAQILKQNGVSITKTMQKEGL